MLKKQNLLFKITLQIFVKEMGLFVNNFVGQL